MDYLCLTSGLVCLTVCLTLCAAGVRVAYKIAPLPVKFIAGVCLLIGLEIAWFLLNTFDPQIRAVIAYWRARKRKASSPQPGQRKNRWGEISSPWTNKHFRSQFEHEPKVIEGELIYADTNTKSGDKRGQG